MGSLNPLSMIIQIGLGALTGGASMLLQAALKAVMSAVGNAIIQQLGQSLGLPQGIIDMAKSAFAAATGDVAGGTKGVATAVEDFASAAGASVFDGAQAAGSAALSIKGIVDQITTEIQKKVSAASDTKKAAGTPAATAGGSATDTAATNPTAPEQTVAQELNIKGGFLVALAQALGEVMDKKSDNIVKLANKINADGQKTIGLEVKNGDTSGASKLQQSGALLQGLAQEINSLSQALSTVLKSIGEGQQTLARKS